MMWLIFIGVCLTLGGFCLCCGCTFCDDGTQTATMQIELDGIAADEDSSGSCCTNLNRTYILDIDPDDPCLFSIAYENGDCQTGACDDCDSSGCTVDVCDADSETRYCPPDSGDLNCPTTSGTVTHGTGCPGCSETETSSINFAPGTGVPEVCECLCVITGLRWDVDVMIIDHPEATWAVPNEFIWQCQCTAKNCTAGVGKSGASITARLQDSSPGVALLISGFINGGEFSTLTAISTDPTIECATSIDALDCSAGLSTTDCSSTRCLCTLPTSVIATYLP